MQRLLWPMRMPMIHSHLPDDYRVLSAMPDGDIQAVLAHQRQDNGKRLWNVYTRYWIRDDDGRGSTRSAAGLWEYRDGLEFRHMETLAREEFDRRVKALQPLEEPHG